MSMEQIRNHYGVPAKRGILVCAIGNAGVIVGSRDGKLRIRVNVSQLILTYHPTYKINYLIPGNKCVCGSPNCPDAQK